MNHIKQTAHPELVEGRMTGKLFLVLLCITNGAISMDDDGVIEKNGQRYYWQDSGDGIHANLVSLKTNHFPLPSVFPTTQEKQYSAKVEKGGYHVSQTHAQLPSALPPVQPKKAKSPKVQNNQITVSKKPRKKRSKSSVTRRESNLMRYYSETANLISSPQTPEGSNLRRIQSDAPKTVCNPINKSAYSQTVPTFCAQIIPSVLEQVTNAFAKIQPKEIDPSLAKKVTLLCKLMEEIKDSLPLSLKRTLLRNQIVSDKLGNKSSSSTQNNSNSSSSEDNPFLYHLNSEDAKNPFLNPNFSR